MLFAAMVLFRSFSLNFPSDFFNDQTSKDSHFFEIHVELGLVVIYSLQKADRLKCWMIQGYVQSSEIGVLWTK